MNQSDLQFPTANAVLQQLESLATPEVAQTASRFFKTEPGQYAAGDTFIGIRVPVLRGIARHLQTLPLDEVDTLIQSPIHEARLLALLILASRMPKATTANRKQIFEFYTRRLQHVNNWDLVDTSAPAIVGGYLNDRSRQPLRTWARSNNLWERRIAIISTQYFIRQGDYDDTLKISQVLLADNEDLIHKATGWMLREVGKRDSEVLKAFLNQHHFAMPRTMLRYAIERLPPAERQAFLQGSGLPNATGKE